MENVIEKNQQFMNLWVIWLHLFQVGKATGKLRRFIIEPFVKHEDVSFVPWI